MRNKKGSTSLYLLSVVILFWILIIIAMRLVGQSIISNSEDLKSRYNVDPDVGLSWDDNLKLIIEIMTFQINEVPFYVGGIIDFFSLIGLLGVIGVIRGL